MISYDALLAAHDLGLQFPRFDQWRSAILSAWRNTLARPMVLATMNDNKYGAAVYRQIADEFNVTFTSPLARHGIEHFLGPWSESVDRQLAKRIGEESPEKEAA